MFAAGDPQGERALRTAIGDYLHSARGVDCRPEQILIGAGSEYLPVSYTHLQNMNLDCTDTYLKPLTVSCGICAAPYAAASMNELISNADCAVYHVKRSGKNGIRVYSDGIIGVRDTDEGLSLIHI